MARPRSLAEFQKAFLDEASCSAFLFRRRWPDGFVCPGCGKRRAATLKSRPRLKMLKRAMYGRAGIELLRARMLPFEPCT